MQIGEKFAWNVKNCFVGKKNKKQKKKKKKKKKKNYRQFVVG